MSAHESAAAQAAQPATGSADPARPLSLAGVGPDGALLLTDGDGATFTLAVDARLRAAVAPAAPASPAQPRRQSAMESALRPRDIQSRIRAGESPEQVAEAARTTVEKVMPFAGPVLAEREHIAERAQKSSVRRPAGAAVAETGARTLGDAVAIRLRGLGLDPTDLVDWDAYRREDGRWVLTGGYRVRAERAAREGSARFTFDPPGNFVTLDNDDARWLVGDLPDAPPAPDPAAAQPGVRRLAAVVDRSESRLTESHEPDADQLSIDDELGLDAVGLVAETPVEAFLDDRPGLDEGELADQAADAAALDPDPAGDPAPEPPRRRPVRKTRGRASVPSWDEIMFGGGE